jgi:hypothetical protein
MPWEVEYLDEFELWWNDLNDEEQETVAAHVELLEERGPQLPFPYSSGIQTSKHGNMRELRIQHQGRPYRVLYAFDPRRVGIHCSAATRQVTTGGTTNPYPGEIDCARHILRRSVRRE